MIEKLFPIKLPPGLYKNGTRYQAKGRWYDASLVRFVSDTIRPVGCWRRMKDTTDTDITAVAGIPRGMIAYRGNNGVIRMGIGTYTNAYAVVDGTKTDITPAGFTTGLRDGGFAAGSGNYGAGNYGGGVYGGGSLNQTLLEADTWQLDSFGDLLVGCFTGDGKIWTWDGNAANNFVQATDSPTSCRAVVVTPERFLVALGASGDPRLVKWATQEGGITVAGDWTPIATNSAGDFPLSTNGRIMAGRRTRRQTLIWTDVDFHTMTYIGGTLIYSFDQAGDNCGLLAPNAIALAGTVAFWMSKDNFFSFDGFVKPIPCDVRDHVFTNINMVQRSKITAHTVSEFNEVWWHYPSAGSLENDSYVVYNYAEGHWTVGDFGRAAAIDKGPTASPVMVTWDGFIFEHEVGFFVSGFEGTAGPFLESGPFELGEGDSVIRVQRIVPDENALGSVQFSIYASMFPTQTETLHGPFSIGQPTNVRFAARQVRLRFYPTTSGDWRAGTIRLGGIECGRR